MNASAGTTRYSKSVLLLVCLLVALTPLAQGSIHLWSKTLIQLSALAGIMLLVGESLFLKTRIRFRSSLSRPLAGIFLLSCLAAVFSKAPRLSLEALILFAACAAVYYMTIACVRTRKEQQSLIYVIVGTAVFLSLLGMLQRFGIQHFSFRSLSVWSPGLPLNATFLNHNHMAGFLEMVIPLVLVFSVMKKNSLSRRMIMIAILLLLSAAHLLTLSRGGWLALTVAMGFLLLAWCSQGRFSAGRLGMVLIFALSAVLLMALASPVVSGRMQTLTEETPVLSFQNRLSAWQGVVAMIKDHPLTGIGPGSFAHTYTRYQPPGFDGQFTMAHNDYLQFIAETGLFLIPLLIWLGFCFFRQGFRLSNGPRLQAGSMAMGVMAAVVAILIHSLYDFNLNIPANAVLFSVLCAQVEV